MISTIELLSNELFIETFQYISTYDLFNIFYSFNFRFFLLINSLKNLHFESIENWDHPQIIIPSFASQIKTFFIQHDQLLNFSSFTNIRSLKLSMPTLQQCNAIQPNVLPNLENLYISNLYYSDNTEQLCRLVFSSSFPYLRTCRMDRIKFPNFHLDSSLSLKQLTISVNTSKTNLLQQIFYTCPRLIHLNIKHHRNNYIEFNTESIPQHIYLQHLSIHFDSIEQQWSHQFKSILSIVPNLKTFILIIDRHNIPIDYSFVQQFADILIQNVPCLLHLKVKIPLNALLPTTLNTIPSYHPLFKTIKLTSNMDDNLNRHLLISSRG